MSVPIRHVGGFSLLLVGAPLRPFQFSRLALARDTKPAVLTKQGALLALGSKGSRKRRR